MRSRDQEANPRTVPHVSASSQGKKNDKRRLKRILTVFLVTEHSETKTTNEKLVRHMKQGEGKIVWKGKSTWQLIDKANT